jgi:hypothetical protein
MFKNISSTALRDPSDYRTTDEFRQYRNDRIEGTFFFFFFFLLILIYISFGSVGHPIV